MDIAVLGIDQGPAQVDPQVDDRRGSHEFLFLQIEGGHHSPPDGAARSEQSGNEARQGPSGQGIFPAREQPQVAVGQHPEAESEQKDPQGHPEPYRLHKPAEPGPQGYQHHGRNAQV